MQMIIRVQSKLYDELSVLWAKGEKTKSVGQYD